MSLEIVYLYVIAFCRITIGFAFLLSSISKALNFRQFRQTIGAFNILSRRYINITALFLICIEAVIALFMILGNVLLIPGFSLAIIFLLLFCMAFLSALARKMVVSCNCFGPSDKPVTGFDIIRNGGFILCAFTGTWLLFRAKQTTYSLSIPEGVMVGLSAIVFVLIWIKLGDIMQFLSQED